MSNKKDKKVLVNLFLIITFIAIIGILYYTKNNEIDNFKNQTLNKTVDETEIYLKTLIKEKQNTTATIGLGLANSELIINTLKNKKTSVKLSLHEYSLQLRRSTDFKNVWFQLISKDGQSLQRSWTDIKNDKISNIRIDIQKMLKKPQIMNSISVGRFDMTFKSMIPVYDPQTDDFLGIIEVITHFNSIAKKLEEKEIQTIVLADKRYKQQLDKPFTKLFLGDYYIANLDANKQLMKHIEAFGVEKFLEKLKNSKYFIDNDIGYLISYHRIYDQNNKIMGHFIMMESFKHIDLSQISEINYIYSLYFLFIFLVFAISIYFIDSAGISSLVKTNYLKIVIFMIMIYCTVLATIYLFINNKYENDIQLFEQTLLQQTQLEYNSIVSKNKDIAQLILLNDIDTEEVKDFVQNRQRDELYKFLKNKYEFLKKRYNVRQIHFHLPDSTSFLRMHRPNKFGDSLLGIRQSVEYVNQYLRPYEGFEEGRIFNGFRYVYPLFDKKQNHIGSVEVGFDIYSFMDHYFANFKTKRVNFLLKKKLVDKKVFESELSNYVQSPIKGFYFDKLVLDKLDKLNKDIIANQKSPEKFKLITNKIDSGVPFVMHFDTVHEITVIIPFINKISGEVIGSINISHNDQFIQNRKIEFKELMIIISVILALIMFFAYREIISKIKIEKEFEKNQKVLDSQKSFIIISDGVSIKASNKTLLEFFGYDDFDKLIKNHDCICDFFEYEEDKNYIQKQMGDYSWFEYIKLHQDQDNLVKMIDKDGDAHIFYIEFNITNMINENDYIVSFIDITHIKSMEIQLVHAEKMASLGAMIGNIAHQWRQPLSAISSLASGIGIRSEFGTLPQADLQKSMKNIVDTTKYLSDTIDTFRDYVKGTKEKTNVVAQDIVDQSINILQPVLNQHHIDLITKFEKNPITVNIVAGELSQVITNLINNAKDVLVEKQIDNPHIIIECFSQNSEIIITIKDNAGGVPNDIINKIFEPYFTTKHQSQGTGLGLYMSHKIVAESLNGTLDVHNEHKGAVFTIRIPLT